MSTKQERLLRLRDQLSELGDLSRSQRRDRLVQMWLSGQQNLLAQIYRDAAKMLPEQRIRADVWFVVEKILEYAERDETPSGE